MKMQRFIWMVNFKFNIFLRQLIYDKQAFAGTVHGSPAKGQFQFVAEKVSVEKDW